MVMTLLPGWLIALLTFPGVIVHELAHKKFCEWFHVPVGKVVYFRLGNPAGYVTHAEPETFSQAFWISTGPLLINSIQTVVLSFIAANAVTHYSGLWWFLIWLAFSSGMHAFPSDQDMRLVLAAGKRSLIRDGSLAYLFSLPFVGLIWLANKLKFFWFDALFALALIKIGGGI